MRHELHVAGAPVELHVAVLLARGVELHPEPVTRELLHRDAQGRDAEPEQVAVLARTPVEEDPDGVLVAPGRRDPLEQLEVEVRGERPVAGDVDVLDLGEVLPERLGVHEHPEAGAVGRGGHGVLGRPRAEAGLVVLHEVDDTVTRDDPGGDRDVERVRRLPVRGDPHVVAAERLVEDVLATHDPDAGTAVDAGLREALGDEGLGRGGAVARGGPAHHHDADPPAGALAECEGDREGGLDAGERRTLAQLVDDEDDLGLPVDRPDAGDREAGLDESLERPGGERARSRSRRATRTSTRETVRPSRSRTSFR